MLQYDFMQRALVAAIAVSHDEEFARASGLPVLAINVALALVTAITVVVSMRVVGLLLISALMIVPVATAQLVSRSFRSTVALAAVLGVAASVAGIWISYETDTPSGGTIVLTTIGAFIVISVGRALTQALRPRATTTKKRTSTTA